MMARSYDLEFTGFIEAHAGQLRHTAYLLTGSQQTAEDLLQDALVKAWLAWRRIDPATAKAYVRRIMVNLMTDRWRKKRYATVPLDIDDRHVAPSAHASFAAAEHRDDIVRQLATLTPRERACVVLRYYHDLPDSEVAQMLGVSVGTVKSTCSRALARLRSRNEAAMSTRSHS